MTFTQVSRWRNIMGKIGMLFCFLIFIALYDAMAAQFRKPQYAFDVYPGSTVKVNGPLPERIEHEDELTYQSTSDLITVNITRLHSGYWMGGNLWNGEVTVSPEIEPGKYQLMVKPKEMKPAEVFPVIEINVYADLADYRRDAKSFILKYLGVPPWKVIAVSLPLVVLAFLSVFKLSQRGESLLLQEGKAEVYRAKKTDTGYEIAFGLGTRDGVHTGDSVYLSDEKGRLISTIKVQKVTEKDSVATVEPDYPVKPGYIVSKA